MTTILVVDDEPAMVGMLAALLGDDGHHIVTAYDGEVALRRHAEERPDLVILDRRLPRMSGDDVVRTIRGSSNTPILMLTGEKGSEERARLWHQMLAIHMQQQYVIGVIAGVPQPVVARDKLMNLPTQGFYNWDPGAFFGIYRPETFWFK